MHWVWIAGLLLVAGHAEATEARAEWALYAWVTDAPWRRRALDPLTTIDAQRTASRGARPTPPAGPPPSRPRLHRRPVP